MFERDAWDRTPLHYAAAGNVRLDIKSIGLKIVQPLIGLADANGQTSLMIAAKFGNVENVKVLISECGV